MFDGYYQGRRVFVTGHTGFKGAWLSLWLRELGAEVWGYGLPPPTEPHLYGVIREGTFAGEVEGDVRDPAALRGALGRAAPELVFHLAAQALVRPSYRDPLETWETNVIGTAQVLQAVLGLPGRAHVVVVTTDKCYENSTGAGAGGSREGGFREDDPLGGHDPYSASKAAAELVAQSWRRSFLSDAGIGVATARAGNVIGGGDYGLDRILPDCARALGEGRPVVVRNPAATRPWQHVFDALGGYLCLGARLGAEGAGSPAAEAFNFGPEAGGERPVKALVEAFIKHWRGPGSWERATGGTVAPHEAERLFLAVDKAREVLGWRPVWGFEEAVEASALWYGRSLAEGPVAMREFSCRELHRYGVDAGAQGRGGRSGHER